MPKTDAAELKLSNKSTRTAAALAAIAEPAGELRFLTGGVRPGNRVSEFPVFGFFCGSGHFFFPSPDYLLNGMPSCFKSARLSASVFAVVVIEIFMPFVFSTLL